MRNASHLALMASVIGMGMAGLSWRDASDPRVLDAPPPPGNTPLNVGQRWGAPFHCTPRVGYQQRHSAVRRHRSNARRVARRARRR